MIVFTCLRRWTHPFKFRPLRHFTNNFQSQSMISASRWTILHGRCQISFPKIWQRTLFILSWVSLVSAIKSSFLHLSSAHDICCILQHLLLLLCHLSTCWLCSPNGAPPFPSLVMDCHLHVGLLCIHYCRVESSLEHLLGEASSWMFC